MDGGRGRSSRGRGRGQGRGRSSSASSAGHNPDGYCPSGRNGGISADSGLKSVVDVSRQSEPLPSSPSFMMASSRMQNMRLVDVSSAAADNFASRIHHSPLSTAQSGSSDKNSNEKWRHKKQIVDNKNSTSGTKQGQASHDNVGILEKSEILRTGVNSDNRYEKAGKLETSQILHTSFDASIGYGKSSHEKADGRGILNCQILRSGVDSKAYGSGQILSSHIITAVDPKAVVSRNLESSPGVDSKADDSGKLENSPIQGHERPYDICNMTSTPQLKTPLHLRNRERRNEAKRMVEGQSIKELKPGMIHLSRYISITDQVKIVKKCRELGLGPGGFYQPGYRDGAKLNLKMMCLGRIWDPQTGGYSDQRSTDGAKAPAIPDEFYELIDRAMQDSHAYLQKQYNRGDVEHILPSLSPDICVVNFYTNSGRLGLHQDKHESADSLKRGLPVVSFSIGASAEFLFGDQRDVTPAEKIVLESGDVLIFGGKSRLVFHGVTTILQETAPKVLLEEANLRPGRLNLTFRQY